MINSYLINEARRIRSQYLKEIELFKGKEDKINNLKIDIYKKVDIVSNYIKNNLEITEVQVMDELKSEITDIEISMDIIQKDVTILEKNINKLKKDSTKLFQLIQKKYPNLSEQDIQKEILYSLKS